MAFASNNTRLLHELQKHLQVNLDVSSFIGWDITRTPTGIKIDQWTYIPSLLSKYGMSKANSVRTPIASNDDLGPATEHEAVLDADGQYMLRAVIGGLLYLAVSARPEFSKPVGSLANRCMPTASCIFEARTPVPDRKRPCRHALEQQWTVEFIILRRCC